MLTMCDQRADKQQHLHLHSVGARQYKRCGHTAVMRNKQNILHVFTVPRYEVAIVHSVLLPYLNSFSLTESCISTSRALTAAQVTRRKCWFWRRDLTTALVWKPPGKISVSRQRSWLNVSRSRPNSTAIRSLSPRSIHKCGHWRSQDF